MTIRTDWMTTVVALAVAAALAGCAGMELDRAKAVAPKGTAFQTELYKGYVTIASREQDEADYSDADAFAWRAMTAAGGGDVPPEPISSRKLPADKVAELTDARGRLMQALAAGAAEKAPSQAANAQVMFDCWMQEQEENFQPEDIARCKGNFMTAIAAAEAAVAPNPTAMRAPMPAPMHKSQKFVVYFSFDSAKITPDEHRTIMDAIDAAKSMGAKEINISGHTDRSGADKYNIDLSRKRADAVADALGKGGLSPNLMLEVSFGEKVPMVETKDNVRRRENRRVEIEISN